MEQIQTQKEWLRAHLLGGGSISALEALRDFGCYRLASRISDLRSEGMNIEKTMEETVSRVTGKTVRFARYRLAQQQADSTNNETTKERPNL